MHYISRAFAIFILFVFRSCYGAEIYVSAQDSLQAALNKSTPGDTLVLAAGATFVGNFVLPKKEGKDWITITGSARHLLPQRRVTPADSQLLPKILTPNIAAAISTAKGAHHYRLLGLEIGTTKRVYGYTLVRLGTGEDKILDDLPSNIEMDRLYIHGDSAMGSKRGIDLNSRSTVVLNSYISDFKSSWQDSQAIASWNGPGPFHIENNYLEGSAENVCFGGALSMSSDMIPSDIILKGNHLRKPLRWYKESSDYDGSHWIAKNLIEFKSGRRVTVENNVLENSWKGSHHGFAIVLVTATEYGKMPWNVTEDLTFRNNLILHTGGGFNISGEDYVSGGGAVRRLVVDNNLFIDLDHVKWGGSGRLFQIQNKARSIAIRHTTALQSGEVIVMSGTSPLSEIEFSDNLVRHNRYGILAGGYAPGSRSIDAFSPDMRLRKNVFIDNRWTSYNAQILRDNYFPDSVSDVKFVNVGSFDYSLRTDSPYINAASDRSAIGANVAEVEARTSRSVSGSGLALPSDRSDDGSVPVRPDVTHRRPVCVSLDSLVLKTLNSSEQHKIKVQSSCQWQASSLISWIQVYPLSGKGGEIEVTIEPNFGSEARQGQVRVGEDLISVSQSQDQREYRARVVSLLYYRMLGRTATAAEIQAHRSTADRDLALGFADSLEFLVGSKFVAGLYLGILGRDPEFGGWLFQRNALSAGRANQTLLINNFLDSAEMSSRFGTLTAESFIRHLYRNILQREPNFEEVRFQSSMLMKLSRNQMTLNFLGSEEFQRGRGNRLMAFLVYFSLLSRDATDDEIQITLQKLATTNGLGQVLQELTGSSEFLSQLR